MFSMASEERTRELLKDAGFTDVRIEEVPVRFTYRDVDDYVERARDTGGVFARVFREVSEDERSAMTAQLEEAFAPFAFDGGYELPGVSLAAVAR